MATKVSLNRTARALLMKLAESDSGMTRGAVSAFLTSHDNPTLLGSYIVGGQDRMTQRVLTPLQRAGLVSAGQMHVRLTARGQELVERLRAGLDVSDGDSAGGGTSDETPTAQPFTDHGQSSDSAGNPAKELAHLLRSVWSDQQPATTEEYSRTVGRSLRRRRSGRKGASDGEEDSNRP